MKKYLVFFATIFTVVTLIETSGCKKEENGPLPSSPVTDYDGNVYQTVSIGSQVWMCENLRTTTYNDGTSIPLVMDNDQWASLETPAFCWYDEISIDYGYPKSAYYNWDAVNTGNLCPEGWHVATHNDWITLIDNLGGTEVAGNKLKEIGNNHWLSENTGATNETGFTALPEGGRYESGAYTSVGYHGYWWTATAFSENDAWFIQMNFDDAGIGVDNDRSKQQGYAVRCIKTE